MNKKLSDFSGKKIIVTGAAGGLGQSLVKALILGEKSKVIAIDINEKELIQLKAEIDEICPYSIEIMVADLTNETEIRNIYSTLTEKNTIYGLINNAGMTDFGLTSSNLINKYQKIIELNFLATMKLSLLFLDHFKIKGEGFIYNITSLTGLLPMAYQNIYSASKHAIQCFTFALDEEVNNREIFIGMFAPGGIDTSMFKESGLSSHFEGKNVGIMGPDRVAIKALKNLRKKKLFSTSSFFDALCVISIRLFPGKLSRYVMKQIYKPQQQGDS